MPPIAEKRLSRRDLLRYAGVAGAAITLASIPDMHPQRTETKLVFPSEQLSVNINVRSFAGYGLDPDETVQKLFSLPVGAVRIPIPFDVIAKKKGTYDFTATDRLIEQAIKHGKKIDLQLGIKTIGWPEIHVPQWLSDLVPSLYEPGAQIDRHPDVRNYTLEYLDRAAERYLSFDAVQTIHVENEAFSRHLQVSNYRYISFAFNEEERAVVQNHNKYNKPFIQNVPLDTPQAIPYVLRNSDIIGLNVYNQALGSTSEELFWWSMKGVFLTARLFRKPIHVTEYQSAAWLKGDKTPLHPFTRAAFINGLRRLKALDPNIRVAFWDLDQILWQRDAERWDEITNLSLLASS